MAAKNTVAALNKEFKNVFLEALKEEGYVKVKGRQPYLVRVVEGGEIIHILTCKTQFCMESANGPQYKAFQILGGVATVYRAYAIDFSIVPSRNNDVLWNLFQFYYRTNKIECDETYRKEVLYSFGYNTDEPGSLHEAMQRALEETRKVMLPVFDKAVNLNACAKLFMRYGQCSDEDLIYLKVDNRAELEEEVEKLLQEETFEDENRDNYRNITKEEYLAELPGRVRGHWKVKMTGWDEILADADKYAEAMKEMECYKRKNTEKLRSFGLSV